LILAALIKADLPVTDFNQPLVVWIAIIVTVAGAAVLGYFRDRLASWLPLSPVGLAEFVRLRWLIIWLEQPLNKAGKLLLRVRVILEGQHYMGWALFTALIGALIILLGT
jgi:hypothetical protein